MQYFRLVIVNHVRTNFYRLWLPMSIDFGHQSLYNPQNEMFRKNKTKRSVPQNEMFLFRVPSPQRKTPQRNLRRFCLQTIYIFRRSSQTSHSRHLRAAALCVLNCFRISVRCRGSTLCFLAADLSGVP